jgi:hypothetical protein
MTKLFSTLALLAAASSTLATAVIWILLTEPATMAHALGAGSVRMLVSAIIGGN